MGRDRNISENGKIQDEGKWERTNKSDERHRWIFWKRKTEERQEGTKNKKVKTRAETEKNR